MISGRVLGRHRGVQDTFVVGTRYWTENSESLGGSGKGRDGG